MLLPDLTHSLVHMGVLFSSFCGKLKWRLALRSKEQGEECWSRLRTKKEHATSRAMEPPGDVEHRAEWLVAESGANDLPALARRGLVHGVSARDAEGARR